MKPNGNYKQIQLFIRKMKIATRRLTEREFGGASQKPKIDTLQRNVGWSGEIWCKVHTAKCSSSDEIPLKIAYFFHQVAAQRTTFFEWKKNIEIAFKLFAFNTSSCQNIVAICLFNVVHGPWYIIAQFDTSQHCCAFAYAARIHFVIHSVLNDPFTKAFN